MIASYMSGRLGNQLFEYAYSRALYEQRGRKDELIFNFELVKAAGSVEEGFEDGLKDFRILPYRVVKGNLVLTYGSVLQKSLYLVYQLDRRIKREKCRFCKWFHRFRMHGIFFQDYADNDVELKMTKHNNVFCYGKYENPKYFDFIRSIIIEEFTPRYAPLSENKELYGYIERTNSVCVSIRRGDFLSDRFKEQFLVCDQDYFMRAIEEIKKRVDNPTFVFFSDDIEWVKDNVKLDTPCYYESGNDPVWEKIRLMYSCKHFILSNSTFSWWAQYLSRNEAKIVISPNRWCNNSEMNKYARLISDNFIRIHTNHHN